MGFNTSALFVRATSPDQAVDKVANGRFTASGEWVDVYDATSGMPEGQLFAAESNGWTQVWDPSMTLVPLCRPPGFALSVVFSSVSSTYAFALYDAGVTVRECVYSSGSQLVDHGTPLPVES